MDRRSQRRNLMSQRILTTTAIAAMVASMGLAGCGQRDRTEAGTYGSETSTAANDQSGRAANTGARMGAKIDDAMITTTVKAELAKDPSLSALKINVDTDNGRVSLKGTAPSNEAREHATTLAQNVKGVSAVDNQLMVKQ
jgi:hyperosmotically inducible protein